MTMQLFIPFRTTSGDATLDFITAISSVSRGGFVQPNPEYIKQENFAPRITVVAGQAKIIIDRGASGNGWVAIAADGMVAREVGNDYTLNVAVGDGVKRYVCLRLKYVATAGGQVSEFQVHTAAEYNAHTDKASLLIVGTFTSLDPVEVLVGEIDYSERHRIHTLHDSSWHPSVDAAVDLPDLTSNPDLREGDTIVVRSTRELRIWNAGTSLWDVYGSAPSTTTAVAARQLEATLELRRSTFSSGILAGPVADGAWTRDDALAALENPAVNNKFPIGDLRAIVNGHFVKTKWTEVTMPAKPGIGERYDLVYIEVYRAAEANPEAVVYPEATGGNLTATQVRVLAKSLGETSSSAATSYDLPEILEHDTIAHVKTVYSYRVIQNVDPTDYFDMAGLGAPANSDGNPWLWSASQADKRVWSSVHSLSLDGYAWSLPLYLVKRTSVEAAPAAISIFRSGARYIFPIAPLSESMIGRQAPGATYKTLDGDIVNVMPEQCSGVLSNNFRIVANTPGGPDVMLEAVSESVIVNGRKLTITQTGGGRAPMPVAPGAGQVRSLVLLTVEYVAFPDEDDPADAATLVVDTGLFRQMNGHGSAHYKRVYAQIIIRAVAVGELLETAESMALLGFTVNAQDPGLWEKAPGGSYDPRHIFDGVAYAIPLAIVHQRNTGAWSAAGNPNGTTNRPDGLTSGVYSDVDWSDIVQLSHYVGADDSYLHEVTDATFRALIAGRLDTKMAPHPAWAGPAGSRHLIGQSIRAIGVGGLTNLGQPADGYHTHWSEADEIVPFGIRVTGGATYSDAVFDWDQPSGTLRVQMPAGLAVFVPPGGADGFYFIDAFAVDGGSGLNCPSEYDSGDNVFAGFTTAGGVVVNATDADGLYPTDLTVVYGAGTGGLDIHFFFWAIQRRHATDPVYTSNGGLLAVPEQPVLVKNGATPYALAPMMISLTKTLTAGLQALAFSAADVSALMAEGGVAQNLSFIGASLKGTARTAYTMTAEINDALDTVTVRFAAPFGTDQTVTVSLAYDTTTTTRWYEFMPGSKGLRGEFFYSALLFTGIDPAHTAKYIVTASTGTQAVKAVGIYWRNSGTANPWDWISPDLVEVDAREGTDTVAIPRIDAGIRSLVKDYMVIVVCLTAPSAALTLDFYYRTPAYQGISVNPAGPALSTIRKYLQGTYRVPGCAFVTTYGAQPLFVGPLDENSAGMQTFANQTERTTISNWSRGSVALGGSVMRARRETKFGRDATYPYDHRTSGIQKPTLQGLRVVTDYLPISDMATALVADWNGDLFTFGEDATKVYVWDLSGHDLTSDTEVRMPGLVVFPPVTLGGDGYDSRPPHLGDRVSYGAYSALLGDADFEDATLIDGVRGVAVTYPIENAAGVLAVVADCVSFLPFGTIDGLMHSEIGVGTGAPMVLHEILPDYRSVGVGPRQKVESTAIAPSKANTYYGGHYSLIEAADNADIPTALVLQVSGDLKLPPSHSPAIAPFRFGGVFDAFWPIGRPLLPRRR